MKPVWVCLSLPQIVAMLDCFKQQDIKQWAQILCLLCWHVLCWFVIVLHHKHNPLRILSENYVLTCARSENITTSHISQHKNSRSVLHAASWRRHNSDHMYVCTYIWCRFVHLILHLCVNLMNPQHPVWILNRILCFLIKM